MLGLRGAGLASLPLRLQLRPFQRQSDHVGACLDGANRSFQFCRDHFGAGVRFRHSSNEGILLWRPPVGHVTTISPSAPALLFLTGWNCLDILFREGIRFRRGRRAPKLRRYAVTSPQLGALDRSDEFAAHRFFWLYLNQRLVADLWWRTLSECGCRKADRGKKQQNSHCHFPFAVSLAS